MPVCMRLNIGCLNGSIRLALRPARKRTAVKIGKRCEIGVRFQLTSISDDCMKLKLGERADERDAALLLS